jgi:hypothetical protein
MAIKTSTTVYDKLTHNDLGQAVKKSVVYQFASTAQNDFTSPVELHGAKSVWVTLASTEDAEFYIPAYSGGDIVASETTNYTKMSASFVSDGTSERAGVGMGIVVPSSSGAGCISGDMMPPALSVKVTGSTTTTVMIHIMY